MCLEGVLAPSLHQHRISYPTSTRGKNKKSRKQVKRVGVPILTLPLSTTFFLSFSISFCLFFFFSWPHLHHMEVPVPGTESEQQLQQHQILEPPAAGQGSNPRLCSNASHCCRVLNPRCQGGNPPSHLFLSHSLFFLSSL